MAVEILSILQQIRFRVVTEAGEYQDALYFPQGATLDLPALTAIAQARADTWLRNARNPQPETELPLAVLTQIHDDLQTQVQTNQSRLDEVSLVRDDVTAPTVPAGLQARVVGTTVELRWQPSTDAVGVAGYGVFRDGALLDQARGNSYVDFTVVRGTVYRYRVRAIDRARNTSALSAQVQVTA